MTTYYVGKNGSDSNAGTALASPKLTIAAVIAVADTAGDVVEIIDTGEYNEGALAIYPNNLTITHTASSPSTNDGDASPLAKRPKIYGTGLGGNPAKYCFYVYGGPTTYNGIEFYDYSQYTFKKGDADAFLFHITGCFIHKTPQVWGIGSVSGSAADKSTVESTVIFLENAGSAGIAIDYNVIFNNCLITSSNNTVNNSAWFSARAGGTAAAGNASTTASFCTIIDRGAGGTGDSPTLWIGKAVNCIVSGGANVDGIASGDHTYNLVHVGGDNWLHEDKSASTTGSTGEVSGKSPGFADGTAVGSSLTVADNFKLTATSACVNAGTSHLGETLDLTGSTRAGIKTDGTAGGYDIGCYEFIPEWTIYRSEPSTRIGGDFTINRYKNMSANTVVAYSSINYKGTPGPFSAGNRAILHRGRTKPYIANEDRNPDDAAN